MSSKVSKGPKSSKGSKGPRDRKSPVRQLPRGRRSAGRRSKPAPRDRWVVVQYTNDDGYAVASIHTDPQEASDQMSALGHKLAMTSNYSGAYTAPVLRGRGRFVTVRKARNADADWRQAVLWPTEAAARAFAARPDAGSISVAHDYVGELPATEEGEPDGGSPKADEEPAANDAPEAEKET